jgi:hypothetical protein
VRVLKVIVLEEKKYCWRCCENRISLHKSANAWHQLWRLLAGIDAPELLNTLGIEIPLLRRDPHYFLPTTGKRYLLFGSDQDAMRNQFISFFSEDDWLANKMLSEEIEKIRMTFHLPGWRNLTASKKQLTVMFVANSGRSS